MTTVDSWEDSGLEGGTVEDLSADQRDTAWDTLAVGSQRKLHARVAPVSLARPLEGTSSTAPPPADANASGSNTVRIPPRRLAGPRYSASI